MTEILTQMLLCGIFYPPFQCGQCIIIFFSGNLKQRFPSGLRNYETTYKHDYFGTLGENREATMQYPDKRSLTPDFSLKTSPDAPRTPSPN